MKIYGQDNETVTENSQEVDETPKGYNHCLSLMPVGVSWGWGAVEQ